MDVEVIQAAKMAGEESEAESLSKVQNISQELINVSPEIQDLLDMFTKQNKQNNEHVDNCDFGNVVTKKDVLVYDELQPKEHLTLYAYNGEASAEPQVIQLNPENNEYPTFFNHSQNDITGSYQVINIDPGQVKNTYPTFITPKTTPESTLHNIPLAKTEAVTYLNSSGYTSANSPAESGYSSANSPIESIDNSPAELVHSPKEPDAQDVSATLSPDHDPLSVPSPDPKVSEISSSGNPYKIPVWVRQVYPELYQTWENTSASEFYQGRMELLCFICKKNPYSGFHENLPVCEADRVGRACTVCRLRSASGFSYGLALCEADRLFLYRTFSQQTKFDRCMSLCPVTVQMWCGYCRLRLCLSTKGFRFFTQASTKVLIDQEPTGDSRKRKYSGKGIVKELNFIPDSVAQDSIFVPNASSPGPGFGVSTPAHAQQTLGNGISTQAIPTPMPNVRQSLAEANPLLVQLLSKPMSTPGFGISTQAIPTPMHNVSQRLAEANPLLVQHLGKPISTPVTSFNPSRAPNFAKPSFHLRPGMSKAEIASNAAAPTHQGRAFAPWPTVGVPSTTFNQQPTSSHPRATTNTPIPPSPSYQNLPFVPPPSAQMGRYGQYFSQYFDGGSLGTRNQKKTRNVGVLTDPAKQEWVRKQQEKYLKFHLRLFHARRKRGVRM